MGKEIGSSVRITERQGYRDRKKEIERDREKGGGERRIANRND